MSNQGCRKAASDRFTVMFDFRELSTLSEAGYGTSSSEDRTFDEAVDFLPSYRNGRTLLAVENAEEIEDGSSEDLNDGSTHADFITAKSLTPTGGNFANYCSEKLRNSFLSIKVVTFGLNNTRARAGSTNNRADVTEDESLALRTYVTVATSEERIKATS